MKRGLRMNISMESKNESEICILVLLIGVLVAIKNSKINIEDAEHYILNPYSVKRIEEMEFNPEITDIVIEACELDNIQRLIPNHLMSTIEDLVSRALSLLENDGQKDIGKKWID